MFERLKKLQDNCYTPTSKYNVSCAVEMKDKSIFYGVNIENPSFKDGMCAEQTAISAAVTAGYKKGDFNKLYLLGSSKYSITPCSLCRQVLIEFFSESDEIISYDEKGKETKYTLKSLCPYSFSGKDLNHD